MRVMIDQRHMAQALAVGADDRAAIGGVHEVVAVGDKLRAHGGQRDRDLGVVHACRQILLRELSKRPQEPVLAQRAAPSQVESAQPAQQRIGVEPIRQGRGPCQAQHHFSDERTCQCHTLPRRPSHQSTRRRHESLYLHAFPDAQQTRHRRRQRCWKIRFGQGQQLVLKVAMELRQTLAQGSIHSAEVIANLRPQSCLQWQDSLHSFCAAVSWQGFTRAGVSCKNL